MFIFNSYSSEHLKNDEVSFKEKEIMMNNKIYNKYLKIKINNRII